MARRPLTQGSSFGILGRPPAQTARELRLNPAVRYRFDRFRLDVENRRLTRTARRWS
jgi:hypothetical protein